MRRAYRAPGLLALAAIAALALAMALPAPAQVRADPGGADKGGAVELRLGQTNQVSVSGASAPEWYRFTTSGNYSNYSIQLENISVDDRIDITLYDPSDRNLGKTGARMGDTVRLDRALEANTEYFVELSYYSGGVSGNYQIQVVEYPCDAGHAKEKAVELPIGDFQSKAIDVVNIDEWFKFKTSGAYSNYSVQVENISVDDRIDITLYDSSDRNVGATGVRMGKTVRLDRALDANAEYYVKINTYSGGLGNYRIAVKEFPCDAGNVKEKAVEIPLDAAAKKALDVVGIPDWLKFKTGGSAANYTIQLENTNIDDRIDLTLYDMSDRNKGSTSARMGKTVTLDAALDANTEYLIMINAYSEGMGDYQVKVAATSSSTTPTASPSATPSASASATPTASASATPAATATATASASASATPATTATAAAATPAATPADATPDPTPAATSEWAVSEVQKAADLKLIPDSIKSADLTAPITRAEFAGVAALLYENLSGKAAIPAVANPFTDTGSLDVLKAYNTDIMIGVSATEFDPDAILNREQAATALTRVFKRVSNPAWTYATDGQFTLAYERPATFADDADISDWAKDSVYFMAANGIILGMPDNLFAPSNLTTAQEAAHYADATREQALAIAVRMVENRPPDSAVVEQ